MDQKKKWSAMDGVIEMCECVSVRVFFNSIDLTEIEYLNNLSGKLYHLFQAIYVYWF